MKSMFKIIAQVGVVTIIGFFAIPLTWAYEEGAAGKAVVEGIITFKGTPPPPKLFELAKFPYPSFCGKVDNDGKGHRILREVTVNNGKLQDVVVSIKNITQGKPFTFDGTDVEIDHCKYLVQGGPSTFVGAVVNGGEIRILNNDADPSDPKSVTGVLHNPHAYEVIGTTNSTMFNKPVPNKGQTLTETVKLLKPGSFMKLEKDQNNYANAYFYPITNPYYAIVGPEGTYSIDQVPAGKYTIVAWHPTLGTQEKEIEVGATGKVTVNFEFSESTAHTK